MKKQDNTGFDVKVISGELKSKWFSNLQDFFATHSWSEYLMAYFRLPRLELAQPGDIEGVNKISMNMIQKLSKNIKNVNVYQPRAGVEL
jgi:hypothetical protein